MNTITLDEKLLDELQENWKAYRPGHRGSSPSGDPDPQRCDDYVLFRLYPIQFATDKRTAETGAIDLFLYSTRLGRLFEMEWHLVCAICGNVVESFRHPFLADRLEP